MKSKLEEIRKPKIDGLIVRSRVQWHEQGEKSSKYFLSLEKRNCNVKNIQYIKKGDTIITQTNTILEEFYNNLERKYSSMNESIESDGIVSKNISATIKPKDKIRLNSELTLQELTEAMNGMKKGKTPGSNGFPVEFFKTFWNELGPFLHRAFIASLKQGRSMNSHREGIIRLIPKQGKSVHDLKGWRPITLLNVDYKIISTAISNRLKSIINDVISPCQNAYISGRYRSWGTFLWDCPPRL